MENKKNNKNIVVSLSIGDKFYKQYKKYFENSHKKYADKIGADFVIIKDWIEKSDKHPTWQKLLMFRIPEILRGNRVLFLDGDVYLTNHSLNIFDNIVNNQFAAVKNNALNIKRIEDGDIELLKIQCPADNRPKFIINSGVFITNKNYKNMMEKVYYTYKDQVCGEQAPFSYNIINESDLILIDKKFNTIIPDYLEVNGYKLSSIIKMYKENYFLHTAGGINKIIINIITLFDKHPKLLTILEKISKIKIFDRLIGIIIKIIHSLWWRFDKIFGI
jgi:hypothetical protein